MRTVRVVAAALIGSDGRVLIAERAPGKHMAGRWEFPGGKRRLLESEARALARELEEELGVRPRGGRRMMGLTHDYPDRRVELSLWVVERFQGTPSGREGQRLKWVQPQRLAGEDILEADRPFITALVEWLSKRSARERLDGRSE